MAYGIFDNGEVIAQFVAPITLKSNRPVFVSDTLSLKRQVTKRAAQRWEIETQLEPLSSGGNKLLVNLVTKGYSETLQIITPQSVGVVYARTSTSSPIATASAGASAVNVSSNANLIPKGTFIKFSNHSKVYMTTSDLTGTGSVGIYPELIVAVSNTSFTHRDDVIMTCVYDTDTVSGMTYSDGILMDVGTVRLLEKL